MTICGTYSGYSTHLKNKTKPCDICRIAANKYRREKRSKDVGLLGYDPRRFKKHNIEKDQYDILLKKYDGKCWVCKESNASIIDHDHRCCHGTYSCGVCIRGVLCSNCNTGIGLFKDSVKRLKEAIEYLDKEQ
jgi:hypothetical protein